jgi:DNA-binding NarL/FixJ family response regulator
MIKIVIADDHRIFRQGLRKMLSGEEGFEVIGEADGSDNALKMIREMKPHVAVLDISMPGTPILEIIDVVQREALETKVIFLTMDRNVSTANKAIQTGAGGYILKDDAFEDLIYAIRTVLNGGTFISPSIAAQMLNNQDGINEEVSPRLTEREREVLRLIASGLSNKEIADKLYISFKTVQAHRMKIMEKLDLHKAADLTRYALKTGIL